MSDTSHQLIFDRTGHDAPAPATALEMQQRLMTQWIELQMRQVEVSGRFLDSHERIALACLGGGDAGGVSAVAALPAAMPPRETESRLVGPAGPRPARAVPALPARPVAPAATRAAPGGADAARPGAGAGVPPTPASAAAPGAPMAMAARASTRGDAVTPAPGATIPPGQPGEPPPTEQFRRDLIAAVADRTGYPVEMLKEDALLEADLGIDSIKTVEIFGSLTDYHRFMPGGGGFDEELLAEFAQLKTLGDIVAMYDRGRSGGIPGVTPRQGGGAAEPVPAAGAVANGAPAAVNGGPPTTNGKAAGTNGTTVAGNGMPAVAMAKAPAPNGHAAPVAAPAAALGQAAAPAEAAAPAQAGARSLERLEVRPMPAPPADGQKKNFPLTTSS